jgi:nucleotide-binding universal stress UspA family protein
MGMKMVETIVCMVRSGGGMLAAQDRAIEMAEQNDCQLVFLHIVNTNELDLDNEVLCKAASEEMTWLGNMTLSLVQKRASLEGIQAKTELRYGSLFEEARDFLIEKRANRLFLGSPYPYVENFEEKMRRIRRFADRIVQETGIPVDIVVADK